MNIIINAISVWNTVYLQQATEHRKKQGKLQEELLNHISPKFDRLKPKRKLTFYIVENELADLLERVNDSNYGRYSVYWKVLNRGPEAISRNMIRGQIRIGSEERSETSNFRGEHIVECYIVHNEVVVARDRIRVPIESNG